MRNRKPQAFFKLAMAAIVVALLNAAITTQTVQAGHYHSGWHQPAGYYYAPPVYYQPAVAPVVYQPVMYAAPVRQVYSHQYVVPAYTRTTYDPYGRFARIKRKTYTPFGTHETKYRFDKKYGTWRVKHDFDD